MIAGDDPPASGFYDPLKKWGRNNLWETSSNQAKQNAGYWDGFKFLKRSAILNKIKNYVLALKHPEFTAVSIFIIIL